MKNTLLVILLFVAFGLTQEAVQDTTDIQKILTKLDNREQELLGYNTLIQRELNSIAYMRKSLNDSLNPPKEETEVEEPEKKKKK